MTGDIPDGDHVSRYCRPSSIGDDGLPVPDVFKLRPGESYLSVNWLEYFGSADLSAAIVHVREAFRVKGFRLAAQGQFAILGVGRTKAAVVRITGVLPRIERIPTGGDASHAGIFLSAVNSLEVAVALKSLIGNDDIHPARAASPSSRPPL